MTRHLLRHIFILLAALMAVSVKAAPAAQLKVSLDSAYLLMGKTTPIHVSLVTNEDAKGNLLIPNDSLAAKVEIHSLPDADTVSLGSGRVEITRDIIIQSFDSGLYQLKPILYVENNETIASSRLALKVLPAVVDSLTTIHDYADVVDVDRRFIDYLPDFLVDYGLWILAVIIVGGLFWWVYRRYFSRKAVEAAPKAKPVPPYERAVGELNRLKAEQLCEHGQEKEFYTRLTDILRVYLHGRFGINAMEMTSEQIRKALRHNEQTRLSKDKVEQVLEIADFVKFAKLRPLPDDNVRAFSSALQFVDDTKPAPEPEPQPEDLDKATDPQTVKPKE